MDPQHQENVRELDNIVNEYRTHKINKDSLRYYLICMIEDLNNQFKENAHEIINGTHIYEKSKYSKTNFYKYLELLFLEGNGDKISKINTGLLQDLTLIIELDTNIKIIIDGKLGYIIIDDDRYVPFTLKGEFSVKIITSVLKKIKELVNQNTKIQLYFGTFYNLTQDDIKYFIKTIFKEWYIFFIEECNIIKENISFKFINDDIDKSITYLIDLI